MAMSRLLSVVSSSNSTSASDSMGDPTAFVDTSPSNMAFEKRLAEIQSVADDALAPLNIDIRTAIMTVLGALREIANHQEAISALSWIDQDKIAGLREYTMAAMEAQSRWSLAMTPPDDIVELNGKALAMRDLLRSDARLLAKRGLIAPELLARFKGHIGYKNVGFELIRWADLMRDCWSAIHDRTPTTEAEVQGAKKLGERLIYAAGFREQAPVVQGEAAKLRQQAFTLMLNAYDETRRAITFLRWHEGDAESIAPSLYAGRKRSVAIAQEEASTAADALTRCANGAG
jgi:hypothetical protein